MRSFLRLHLSTQWQEAALEPVVENYRTIQEFLCKHAADVLVANADPCVVAKFIQIAKNFAATERNSKLGMGILNQLADNKSPVIALMGFAALCDIITENVLPYSDQDGRKKKGEKLKLLLDRFDARGFDRDATPSLADLFKWRGAGETADAMTVDGVRTKISRQMMREMGIRISPQTPVLKRRGFSSLRLTVPFS